MKPGDLFDRSSRDPIDRAQTYIELQRMGSSVQVIFFGFEPLSYL